METELKLTTNAAHLHAVSAQQLLQEFATAEPVTRRLTAHYFDTPDAVLQRHGLTLRVRNDADHPVQTLKGQTDGAVQAAPLARAEWETPVQAEAPDLEGLRKSVHLPRKVDKTLRRVGRAGTLVEQFTVDAVRTTWLLDIDGASIEMALDDAAAIAPGVASSFAEIELELKSGRKAALYAAARQLARHIPVQLSFVTKAERGFALLNQGLLPRKAQPIALRAHASVEQGMRAILLGCLAHAQSNAQGFLDSDDPEYLHQLRVGMRRFKSALKLFRDLVALPADLQTQLDDLATLLGQARDADVLSLTTLPGLAGAAKHQDFLLPLQRQAIFHATERRSAARFAVHTTGHAQLMLALFEWVDGKRWRDGLPAGRRASLRQPLAKFADAAIEDANARVARRARQVRKLGGRDSASLHRLRIACKQARYAVEFFSALARPARAARYIKNLSHLQDALGKLNDAHVAESVLDEIARATPALSVEVEVASAYLHGMVEAQTGNAAAPWRKLKRSHPALDVRRLVRVETK